MKLPKREEGDSAASRPAHSVHVRSAAWPSAGGVIP